MGFIIRGFIWDIPILIFASVLLGGPKETTSKLPADHQESNRPPGDTEDT